MTSGVVDLSPFDFLNRLVMILPPTRKQWHRYQGVFATNHPPRPVVTAMTIGKVDEDQEAANRTDSINEKPCSHDTSRIAWAKRLDKVGEAFPLACLNYGSDVRLISYITQPETTRKILERVREPLEPPYVSLARRPPVAWDDLVKADGNHSLNQALSDDLPMIDIHQR